MSVINTNYLALVSQNNLTKSQNSLGTAIERLSSGLRINSAKDDAAGQAIANRFTANINGLQQASRNANDGISIAQTTEGALNEINENLQRIRTLTVQATTGSNSASDLNSIQDEINQRMSEINRVSEQTQFNGVKVLAKSADKLDVQVGAHDGETISINLRQIDQSKLNLDSFSVAAHVDTTKVATAASKGTGKTIALDKTDLTLPTDPDATGGAFGDIQTTADGKLFITVTGATGTNAATVNGSYAVEVDQTTGAISLGAKGTFTVDPANTGAVTETTYGGVDFKGADKDNVFAYNGSKNDPEFVVVDNGKHYVANISKEGNVTRGAELTTTAQTEDPLAALDAAIADVDSLRSELGAVQNRFQSTIANLNNTVNNLSAARSRIEDADYAVEVSNMTRSQILQQAGTSVLAQANQVPQTVLSLLR